MSGIYLKVRGEPRHGDWFAVSNADGVHLKGVVDFTVTSHLRDTPDEIEIRTLALKSGVFAKDGGAIWRDTSTPVVGVRYAYRDGDFFVFMADVAGVIR